MAKEMQEGKLNPNEGKLKALQAAMAKIEKDFGKGSIMKLGDEHVENIEVIPTGSIALDNALGVGGYPKGRIIEIYGPESSGKTTLAIHAIAEAQKAGGIAAFIDADSSITAGRRYSAFRSPSFTLERNSGNPFSSSFTKDAGRPNMFMETC